ncbi:HAMP domain-containing histidine kinase [Helicobacter sp. MIT 11-5569]|uniref:sensor histidine kinase n=1 Tax=Helicobacter sp. MIT 11-5569 TaxID=1548151 RepID=UPI0009DE6D72|nr:HAMP domain-containing sensor histidine kinase [Helicobacter sp. MIT 11-5569]TLD84555.1 HAMP domain-containing histidine kinase [Helicobacter sp. MIT 11-5569]
MQKAQIDVSKKTAFKILALYMLTSCVFLVVVFYGWYQTKKDSILESKINALFENAHTLVVYLYEQSQNNPAKALDYKELFKSAYRELGIPFLLVRDNGEIIFSALEEINTPNQVREILDAQSFLKASNHRRDKIVFADTGMYFITQRGGRFWHLMQRNFRDKSSNAIYMLVYSKGIQSELYALLGVIFASFIGALLAMSVVAYFLLSLSLKPLREKIQHLNAFIKDSTHEINTPLSIILMSIERIKTQELSTAEQKKFERIKLAAQTLEQIYQDLLFNAFDEAKDSKLETIALEALIAERIAYFEPFFKQKNIAITFSLKGCTKSSISANHSRISRVVDNLLDNALKYTQNGGSVEVTLGQNFLRIKDNGCGINKKHLDKIFKRYYRANADQGGFGIGLALVQQICALYKITITCTSVEGEGSTFQLEW